jgi:endo-1,4-beta-mannosidase
MGCFEFGNSTLQVTEEDQAANFRVLLFSSFIAGAHCMFPWTYCDMDRNVRQIYNSYCSQELEFGIVHTDRSQKKAVCEFTDFINIINKIDLEVYSFAKLQAATYVEKGYYDRLFMNSLVYPNAYMMARAANIPVNFVRYDEDLTQYKLLFVPNGILTIEEMDKITAFVEQGGTAYMSFNKYIHGMAAGYMQEVFGLRQKDFIRLPEEFNIQLEGESESIKFSNMDMVFRNNGVHPYIFFHVEPTTAEVLAKDSLGRPVICVNKYGKGKAVCCAFPVELCMAQIDDAFQHIKAYKIYEKVAKLAGMEFKVRHQNPFVETGYMSGNNGTALLFLINHEPTLQQVSLSFNIKFEEIIDFETGLEAETNFTMQPNEVRVLKLQKCSI